MNQIPTAHCSNLWKTLIRLTTSQCIEKKITWFLKMSQPIFYFKLFYGRLWAPFYCIKEGTFSGILKIHFSLFNPNYVARYFNFWVPKYFTLLLKEFVLLCFDTMFQITMSFCNKRFKHCELQLLLIVMNLKLGLRL